jgi:hypothetical protein
MEPDRQRSTDIGAHVIQSIAYFDFQSPICAALLPVIESVRLNGRAIHPYLLHDLYLRGRG